MSWFQRFSFQSSFKLQQTSVEEPALDSAEKGSSKAEHPERVSRDVKRSPSSGYRRRSRSPACKNRRPLIPPKRKLVSDFPEKLVGPANESFVSVEGKILSCLLDTGSMVSTISRSAYQQNFSDLTLHPLTELSVSGVNGASLPYYGFIEVAIKCPFIDHEFDLPLLVVPDTAYNARVPVLVGTNILHHMCELGGSELTVPKPWKLAVTSLVASSDSVLCDVVTTQPVTVPPDSKTRVTGLCHGLSVFNKTCAMAETVPGARLPGDVIVVPTFLQLKGQKKERVGVYLYNHSQRPVTIPGGTLVCQLSQADSVKSKDEVVGSLNSTLQYNCQSDQSVLPFLDLASDRLPATSPMTEHQSELLKSIDLSHLSLDTRSSLQSLFVRFDDVFSLKDIDLGRANLVTHRIELSDTSPFKQRHRRIPPSMYQEVKNHLQQMLQAGVIRHSKSPWASNMVLVRKKCGGLRLCVDFRQLNGRTIRDSHALPRMEETFDCLAGAKYFTSLDLRSGYWQVELAEEHKCRTAFTAGPLGFYEFNVLPFGLCNAPSTFQRLMERCLQDIHLRECLVYLDDIIVFSSTIEEHIRRLEM